MCWRGAEIDASLTLAVAQPLTVSFDIAGNARRHAEAIREADARVVVFPELSLTGYEFDASAVDCDDARLAPLVSACADAGTVALAGAPVGAAVSGPGPLRHRHIAMLGFNLPSSERDPGERSCRVVYRKRFLGAAEAAHFLPGSRPAVVEVDGWRLGLGICKDTGVDQQVDDTAGLGIDVYVAGVLESADEADVQPARAGRIVDRHRVWVAIASFAGSTGEGYSPAAGCSSIWRPDGSVAAQAGPDTGAIARTELTRGSVAGG